MAKEFEKAEFNTFALLRSVRAEEDKLSWARMGDLFDF